MAGEVLPSGSTNTQGLADWASPYITNYLGKAQALSETPYQVYQGPLTAGASNLQTNAFQGLGSLTVPSSIGQAATTAGNYATQAGGMSYTPQTTDFLGNANRSGATQQMQQQAMPAYAAQQPMGNQMDPGAAYRSKMGATPPGLDEYISYAGGKTPPGMGFTMQPQAPANGAMVMPGRSNMSEILGSLGMAGNASRAAPTEADWNKFASKARFASEADMEKSKANFLAGGQGAPSGGMLTPYSGKTPDYATGGDYTGGKGAGVPFAQSMGQLGMAPQQRGDTDLTMPFMGAPTGQKFGMSDLMGGLGGAEMPQLNQIDPSSRVMNPGLDDSNMGRGGGKNLGGPEMGAYNTTGGMQPQVMQTFPQQGGMPQQAQTGIAGLQPPQASQPVGSIAQQYMNPYLQAALNPQLEEARRQSQITAQQNAAKMTGAGAFGGSRQAILDAENQRNLGTSLSKITGEGYNTAYDKAMAQFNADQQRKMQEGQFGATYGLDALRTGITGAQTQGHCK
jgi:hypothetical protein